MQWCRRGGSNWHSSLCQLKLCIIQSPFSALHASLSTLLASVRSSIQLPLSSHSVLPPSLLPPFTLYPPSSPQPPLVPSLPPSLPPLSSSLSPSPSFSLPLSNLTPPPPFSVAAGSLSCICSCCHRCCSRGRQPAPSLGGRRMLLLLRRRRRPPPRRLWSRRRRRRLPLITTIDLLGARSRVSGGAREAPPADCDCSLSLLAQWARALVEFAASIGPSPHSLEAASLAPRRPQWPTRQSVRRTTDGTTAAAAATGE